MKRGSKHFKTFVCLIVGMLVLTSAVYANYDSAGGYTNGKEAVKYLLLEAENFTVTGEAKILLDGEELSYTGFGMEWNGSDDSHSWSESRELGDNELSISEDYCQDGWSYYVDHENNSYRAYESGEYSKGRKTLAQDMMGLDENDETSSKAIRFVELMVDTFVGDLKNNIVMVNEEDGCKDYSISLSKGQVPEIVNAAFALIFTENNSYNYDYEPHYVSYQNYSKAYRQWAVENYGEEGERAWSVYYGSGSDIVYETLTDEDWEDFDKICREFEEQYESILQEYDTGIINVAEDGTWTYYPDYDTFNEEVYGGIRGGDDLTALLGNDPYVSLANCDYSIDKKGRLTAVRMDGILTGYDEDGEKHQIEVLVDMDITDYGTTVPERFDPEGMDCTDSVSRDGYSVVKYTEEDVIQPEEVPEELFDDEAADLSEEAPAEPLEDEPAEE